VRVVNGFREQYHLKDFTIRQIDKFLWHYGRTLYGGG
jgi:hypothetical protein